MKYQHTEETKIVLNDLINRVQQLVEVNEKYRHHDNQLVDHQKMAFESVLSLLEQVRDTGHVMRGNNYFPDSVEPIATTKWDRQPQLGLSENQ